MLSLTSVLELFQACSTCPPAARRRQLDLRGRLRLDRQRDARPRRDLADREAAGDPGDHRRRRPGPLARSQGDRPRRTPRREHAPLSGGRARSSTARAQRAKSLGSLLKSMTTTVVFGIAFVMVLSELGINVGPDPGQRRRARPGHRFRRPEPRQGLPVRRDDDDRGPVRRRRRGRPRRGHRHRGARRPAGHPRPRRGRHRLVRPQRRDPARRQREPELGPHRARRQRRLRARTCAGCARCSRTSPTACGTTRTTRTSSSRSPRSGASRASTPDGVVVRVTLKTAPMEQWARRPRDARADQGPLRPRGHRDAAPAAALLAAGSRAGGPRPGRTAAEPE